MCTLQKLDIELQGHQPVIERVLNTGNGLIADKHFAAPDIKHKMDELSNDWDDLMKQSANRRNQLDASLAKHKVERTADVTNDRLWILQHLCSEEEEEDLSLLQNSSPLLWAILALTIVLTLWLHKA